MNDTTTQDRPLGFWLRAVDDLLTRHVDEALADEGVHRGEWMLLSALCDEDDRRAASLTRHRPHLLEALIDRGWVDDSIDTPTVTPAGEAARERLSGAVTAVGERMAGAVSDEDLATTLRSLAAIADKLSEGEAFADSSSGDTLDGVPARRRSGFRPPFAHPRAMDAPWGRWHFGRGPFARGHGPLGRGHGPFGRGHGPFHAEDDAPFRRGHGRAPFASEAWQDHAHSERPAERCARDDARHFPAGPPHHA